MCEWTAEDAAQEINEIKKQNARIEIDYNALLQRELKAVKCTRRVGAGALNNFVRLYVRFLFITRDMRELQRYLNLSPNDRDLLARDAFDQSLIKVVADTINSESVVAPNNSAVVKSILDLDASVVEEVLPDDSVSRAASEVVSVVSRSVRELPRTRRQPSQISKRAASQVSRASTRPKSRVVDKSTTSRLESVASSTAPESVATGSVATAADVPEMTAASAVTANVAASTASVADDNISYASRLEDPAPSSYMSVEVPDNEIESFMARPDASVF
jgi:hypothetical protein